LTETVGEKALGNIPTIVGIASLLLQMSNYFVKGGVPGAATLRTWFSISLPFVLVIASAFLCITHARHIMRQSPRWYNSVIYWIFFVVTIVIGFGPGPGNEWYGLIVGLFNDAAPAAIMGICSIGIIVGYFRTYIARSVVRILMIFFGLLAIAHGTGVMAVAFPFLNPVYIFGESYIIGQAEFGVWLAYHMGVVALASRVLMGREKLRPE
jgi:hypothetical protein